MQHGNLFFITQKYEKEWFYVDIKRFYAIQCKKFLALFLSLVCLVTTVLSPSIVLADNDSYVFKPEYTKIQGLMDYVMSGVMGVFPGDFNTFYQNNKEAYDKWYEKVYGYNYSGTNHSGGGKELTVKADDMEELYNLAKENVWAVSGYWLIEPQFGSIDEFCAYKGYSKTVIDNLKSSSEFSPENFFYYINGAKTLWIYSLEKYRDVGFYQSWTSLAFPESDGSYYTSVPKFKDGRYYNYETIHSTYKFNYCGTHTMKMFYSESDYLKWKTGTKPKICVSSNFLNYSPTEIKINSDKVQNYTTNNTTQKIYNESVTNITNNGGEPSLRQEQVQKIVDDAVQKVLDAMPTPTPTPGGDSGGTPDNSTKEFFQKICDYFEENNKKLEDIIKLFDTAGKSDCNYNYSELSDFLSTLWNESDKKFDTMISLLEKNNVYQEKMLDSLNQIKALLVVDSVLDVFKDRSTETANKAKEKFPTSVPWDVAMIVNAMSAKPQAPVMKIPLVLEQFGISEEVTIDLSSDEWEKLAKLCRYLLSLLFLLFMVHLTRKLFYKDGDD